MSTPCVDKNAGKSIALPSPSHFGSRLRAARREAHITQDELGGATFSGSYVSLIESGRRAPTEAFLHHVSSALGLTEEQIDAWSAPVPDTEGQLAALLAASQEALSKRRHHEAHGFAAEGARLAEDSGQTVAWWTFVQIRLAALTAADSFEELSDLTAELLDREFVIGHAPILARVLLASATSKRILGLPADALQDAQRAVGLGAETDHAPWHPQARRAVVAALVAVGQHDRALAECEALEGELDPSDAGQVGETLWSKGNILFALGRLDAAVQCHDRAFDLMAGAAIDPELWHRFTRASAHLRLRHLTVAGATARVVDTAAHGLASLHTPGATAEASFLLGCLSALLDEPEAARRALLPLLDGEVRLEDSDLGLAAELLADGGEGAERNRLYLRAARHYAAADMHDHVARVLPKIAV